MSVFSRSIRRLALIAALLILLGSLSGCAELKSELKQSAELAQDLLMNSISRFPEGGNNTAQKPEDVTLPPEFEFTAPGEPQILGVVSTDVNIRSGPNAEYDHLGSLLAGTEVKIHHQLLLGNSPWGLTDAGWISMNYILLNDPNQAISIPQTDGKTCLIVIPDLEVRTGPGWQYPSADIQMEGFTTHVVKAQSGNWILLEQGWVSKDGVYLQGTEPARTGTVTGSEVNIRSGPGTQYDVVGRVVRNDTLTVFHQVEVKDNKYWGYTSAGWISMSYVKLEDLKTEQPTEQEESLITLREGVADSRILGQWQNAVVTSGGSSLVFIGQWEFLEDATFTYRDDSAYHSVNKSLASGGPEEETERVLSGLYTYDGGVLTLYCTADSAADEGTLPYILLLNVTIDGGVMTMASANSVATLYPGSQDAVASLLLGK